MKIEAYSNFAPILIRTLTALMFGIHFNYCQCGAKNCRSYRLVIKPKYVLLDLAWVVLILIGVSYYVGHKGIL